MWRNVRRRARGSLLPPAMTTPTHGSDIFESNPYEGHPNLSELEAEVLWQYAKLAQNMKEVRRRHRRAVSCPFALGDRDSRADFAVSRSYTRAAYCRDKTS